MEDKKLNKLLIDLDKSLNYLSVQYRIPGYTKEDVKQELVLKILEDWKIYKNKQREKGFWFMRLKWHLLNIIKKESKETLNMSINIKIFNQENG